jgi:putative Mg2+ transporter-C (MgtC) family protein
MDYEIFIRFLLALLWGGIVGAEREYRGKSAGFRTVMMISIGACFFTMMSVRIGGPGNMDRIASNIVTGIGFLGAGVIFRGENRVNGITTAATIWAVAAVGMGIGAGYYFASACACLLILIVLAILPFFEQLIDRLNQSKDYSITCVSSGKTALQFEQLMEQNHLKYTLTSFRRNGNDLSLRWSVQGRAENHNQFIAAILNDNSVQRFEY